MVEKAGHKKRLMVARNEWINEGKPTNTSQEDDLGDDPFDSAPPAQGDDDPTAGRPATPPAVADVPDDDDLYDATPRAPRRIVPVTRDEPDDDDLDALMAEAEGYDKPNPRPTQPTNTGDDDDLDALMAEAEGHDNSLAAKEQPKAVQSTAEQDDFDDAEAAMREMDGF